MRTKTVTVHYCGYCSKRMFKIPSMERHERGCTANPNRVCKMCALLKQKQPATQALIDFVDADLIRSLPNYRKLCGGCPACMLTGIRLSRAGAGAFGYRFDFKDELERFWKEREEEQRRSEEFSTFTQVERSWL